MWCVCVCVFVYACGRARVTRQVQSLLKFGLSSGLYFELGLISES